MGNIADEIITSLKEESEFFEKTDGWPLYMEGGEDEEGEWTDDDEAELRGEQQRDDAIWEAAGGW